MFIKIGQDMLRMLKEEPYRELAANKVLACIENVTNCMHG